jgi:hypothetical protein
VLSRSALRVLGTTTNYLGDLTLPKDLARI